jgi:hypothetical protein
MEQLVEEEAARVEEVRFVLRQEVRSGFSLLGQDLRGPGKPLLGRAFVLARVRDLARTHDEQSPNTYDFVLPEIRHARAMILAAMTGPSYKCIDFFNVVERDDR